MIGLLFAMTACSSNNSSNVNPATGNNNANAADNNVNTAAANNNADNAPVVGNVQRITDIKKPELLNTTVTVRGIVVNNFKMGTLSGYRLKDGTDSIPISTPNLAKINSTVTVTGRLKTSSYFGFYVLANG